MKPVHKIVIFRLGNIGDIILTSALIRCLKNKYPASQISFVIKREFFDLVKNNPALSEIITFDKNEGFKGLLRLRKKIKNKKYDWLIDLHLNIRSNIVKRGMGIPYVTRYHKILFARSLLIFLKINIYKVIRPIYLRFFEAVHDMEIEYDGKGTEVFFEGSDKLFIENILREKGYNTNNIAVICPGASFTNKQWNAGNFATIALYLKNNKNLQVVLLGGKSDIETCQEINKKAGGDFLNLAGKLQLLESAALLKLSKITVTNDSGMMHLAQAQKSPVLSIFGPTTKELGYFPMPENSKVIEIDLFCRPCTSKGLNHCPRKHHRCMELIHHDMVIKGIHELID